MDGIANVARQQQQQSQINVGEAQGGVAQIQQHTQKPQSITKQIQEEITSTDTKINADTKVNADTKINSKEELQNLVDKLNEAMAPISTNLKFGVDRDDIFYVSVLESRTNKMIRRFPAEQAMEFLPKMQEVTGILFDSKG